jgi:hypothetical protein
MYAVLAALRTGCHPSVLVSTGLADGKCSSATSRASCSAIVLMHRLGCVTVIVPDRFQTLEGIASDDVHAWPPVAHNKVLRRQVAGQVREAARWR